MDTIAYIDGYNLYYGRLRGTPYKWLDLISLIESICKIQDPNSKLLQVKYFTSPVKANLATHGIEANKSQNTYHKALRAKYPDRIDIIMGGHYIGAATAPSRSGKKIDRTNKVSIWKLEEKQTDVNIALHIYRDIAVKQTCQQAVLVSADTDLEPALELIKQDAPGSICGLILPNPEPEFEKTRHERMPKSLMAKSDWTRKHIKSSELESHQLPTQIPGKRTPAIKPDYW